MSQTQATMKSFHLDTIFPSISKIKVLRPLLRKVQYVFLDV